MTAPVRLQLSRRRGFNLQSASREANGLEAVSVARPTKWGNPFSVEAARNAGYKHPQGMAVYAFKLMMLGDADYLNHPDRMAFRKRALEALSELRGKNLACWCKPGDPCHADVLLEIANGDAT